MLLQLPWNREAFFLALANKKGDFDSTSSRRSIGFMNAEPSLKPSFGQLDPPTASGADLASREPDSHRHDLGTPNHYPVPGPSEYSCAECNGSFRFRHELEEHVISSHHSPYACSCGKRFSRTDTLRRHINSFDAKSHSYPCYDCRSYRDGNAFRRRDHLLQHLRNYHNLDAQRINLSYRHQYWVNDGSMILVCHHSGCEHYRNKKFRELSRSDQKEQSPFKKVSDYTKHLKEAHGETAFHCHVAGCDRKGSKGYLRESDFRKHLARQHPDAPKYSPAPRKEEPYNCPHCEESFRNLPELGEHRCIPSTGVSSL
ncbi:hypothetical protein K445DRAFT_95771 [Daldinia sp. EC12]|nr:hypothetical protein K445DRAFT_95771 [Daldinia sp. EC12]